MKIINAASLTELCEYMLDGEPVFIIRAQDKLAVEAVKQYIELSQREGGKNLGRCAEHLNRMAEWRSAHPYRIKLPD